MPFTVEPRLHFRMADRRCRREDHGRLRLDLFARLFAYRRKRDGRIQCFSQDLNQSLGSILALARPFRVQEFDEIDRKPSANLQHVTRNMPALRLVIQGLCKGPRQAATTLSCAQARGEPCLATLLPACLDTLSSHQKDWGATRDKRSI